MTDSRCPCCTDRNENELPSTSVKKQSSLYSLKKSNSFLISPRSSQRRTCSDENKLCMSEWRRYRRDLDRCSRVPLTESEENFYEELDKRNRTGLRRSRSRLKRSRSLHKRCPKSCPKSHSIELKCNEIRPIKGYDDTGPSSIKKWHSDSGPRKSSEREPSPRRRSSGKRPHSILKKSDERISPNKVFRIVDNDEYANRGSRNVRYGPNARTSYRQSDGSSVGYDNVCGCPWSIFKRCYQSSDYEDVEEMRKTEYRKSQNYKNEKEMQRPERESLKYEREKQRNGRGSREYKDESRRNEEKEMPRQYRTSRHSAYGY